VEKAASAELRRSFWWWGRNAFALAAAFLTWQVLLIARSVVSALLVVILLTLMAGVVALLCSPATDLLQRRAGLPRTAASLLTLAVLVGALVGIVLLIVNPLIAEGHQLVTTLPALQKRLDELQAWLAQHGINAGAPNLQRLVTSVLGSSPGHPSALVVSAITGTLAGVVDLVVVLVAAFWFLRDGDGLRRQLVGSLPAGWRAHVDFGLRAFGVVIGGYARGQLVMALMVGVMAGVAAAAIGVPFPLVVAAAAGLFELIPLVGPFAGGAVAGVLALTVSPVMLLEVVGAFLIIHLIEGYVVAPRLQGRYVRLHPVIAFLSLFAGVEAAGFLGALLAVPLASLAMVLIQAVIGDVRAERPELFDSGGVAAAALIRERRRLELLRRYRVNFWGGVRRALRRLWT
jgi:predicted PurR-regulated permease PerM